jgi:hypothetical protein
LQDRARSHKPLGEVRFAVDRLTKQNLPAARLARRTSEHEDALAGGEAAVNLALNIVLPPLLQLLLFLGPSHAQSLGGMERDIADTAKDGRTRLGASPGREPPSSREEAHQPPT